MTQTENDIDAFDGALARLEAQLETASAETDNLDRTLSGMGSGAAAAHKSVKDLDRSLSNNLQSAMRASIFEGEKLSSVFRNLAQSMIMSSFEQSTQPLTDALAGVVTNAVGGLVSAIVPFAKGGVISEGRVQPFARGGVVSSPTTFPMRSGTGLMGEAGPEAIMPLARGPDGRLGVRGEGQVVQVTMNISTPDATSFTKSRSQIAAGLSRALQAGRRNL